MIDASAARGVWQNLKALGLVLALGSVVFLTLITCLGTNANKTFSTVSGTIGSFGGGSENPAPDQARSANEAIRPVVWNDPAALGTPRRIIYTAQVSLVVEDFAKSEERLLALVGTHKAYVAKAEAHGTPGERRTGSWTVRVPVENFPKFLEDVGKVGELQRSKTDSQDVTEEYLDLEARIRIKKQEEERLVVHLRQSTGKLAEILTVERELSRVREEIERMQGRMNYLAKLSALSTVTIAIQDRTSYTPPPPAIASFDTTIARTFGGSFDVLVDFGKWLVLIVVALAPWLPVIGVIALSTWLAARRWQRRRAVIEKSMEA